jgi:uncharacterized membrane protein YfcA
MSASTWIALILVFFLTSVIGVVTGSNSLITVPWMFQLGVPERQAVATNMFGLLFMSIGASIPFVRRGTVELRSLVPASILTAIGSTIGALITGWVSDGSVRVIVPTAMIVIALFTLFLARPRRDRADNMDVAETSRFQVVSGKAIAGYAIVLVLAIYGGFYSGGYVTLLTPALVAFFGISYGSSIGVTKVLNVFSSFVATLVFMWQGLVDYKLGIVLAVTMFVGAYIGARVALRMDERLLRAVFVGVVIFLAAKTLWDVA